MPTGVLFSLPSGSTIMCAVAVLAVVFIVSRALANISRKYRQDNDCGPEILEDVEADTSSQHQASPATIVVRDGIPRMMPRVFPPGYSAEQFREEDTIAWTKHHSA